MTPPLAILCLHRVLPEDARDAWPYFLRGTAVTPECLRAHLGVLARYGAFADPRAPLCPVGARQGRPTFWLTFDDGYVDTLTHARPVLEEAGVRASVFVTTRAALGELTLPADRWYAVVTSARRNSGYVRWREGSFEVDLSSREGRRRAAHSAERRACLDAVGARQEEMLAALEGALDGSSMPRARLYLDREELRALRAAGWSIGGHGASHAPLPQLSASELLRELSEMDDGLRRLGEVTPVGFAYPDGQSSIAARDMLEARGCLLAVALGDAVVQESQDRLSLPRFIVPNDPAWVERFLVPLLREVVG